MCRRPNAQLVREFEALIDADLPRFVKMAAPLAFGHLVRVTCARAGNPGSAESIKCVKEFASGYVNKAWQRYQGKIILRFLLTVLGCFSS